MSDEEKRESPETLAIAAGRIVDILGRDLLG